MIAIRKRRASGCQAYEPSVRDIRRACAEIQAKWSPRERARRDQGPRAAWWTPPLIRLSELDDTLNGDWGDSPLYGGAAGSEAER